MKKQALLGKSWLVGLAMLSACSGAPVQLGPELNVKYDSTQPRQISADSCGFQLLLVIPIDINGRALRAYERLKAQAQDSYITDVKVTERWYYALVGTVYCTEMQALAYPKTKT
jgi:hypothetical protein